MIDAYHGRRTAAAAILAAAMAVAAGSLAGTVARAAEFPVKPLRVIVPFAPGGNTSFVMRVVAQPLEQHLGQPIVIDHRSGAQGLVGLQIGTQASPDGYTIALSDSASVIAPAMMDKPPFDVLRDFAPVGLLIEQPYYMAVGAAVPANTLAEFIAHAQANPGKLNFGSGGAINQVVQEVFFALAKLRMTHIAYRGTAPLMTGLLGNEVQVTVSGPGSIIPQVRAGKLKALAVTTLKRGSELPDVPTLDEQGFKGFEVRGWYGLLAPAGTPRAAIARLNTELNRALTAGPAPALLRDRGFEPAPVSPDAFGKLLRTDLVRWSEAIRKYNIRQLN
ncbi:MAG: tripartite tricarboxylate transporter substrate binding protein [Betaproteobacteria bacterium]|jgi:tripartite-type tricarboxylate transporter receptor subunit TctC|nr:tripartite tricarboxylate transporter substrate binding protein [Betaproteobacteria bacterium]